SFQIRNMSWKKCRELIKPLLMRSRSGSMVVRSGWFGAFLARIQFSISVSWALRWSTWDPMRSVLSTRVDGRPSLLDGLQDRRPVVLVPGGQHGHPALQAEGGAARGGRCAHRGLADPAALAEEGRVFVHRRDG